MDQQTERLTAPHPLILRSAKRCSPMRCSQMRCGPTLGRTSSTDESAVAAAGGALPDLAGSPVSALWDPDLEQAMRRAGQAVHEELVLAALVEDLTLRPAHT